MARAVPLDLLPGRLDLPILRPLAIGSMLKHRSRDVLQLGKSSLCPALQRPPLNGHVEAEWGPAGNGRQPRYDALTRAGRKHLAAERAGFEELVVAIRLVLERA